MRRTYSSASKAEIGEIRLSDIHLIQLLESNLSRLTHAASPSPSPTFIFLFVVLSVVLFVFAFSISWAYLD